MLKKIIYLGCIGLLISVFLSFYCDDLVKDSSKDFIVLKRLSNVGVVLGTAKYVWNKNENLFYKFRIQKAVELYKKGLVNFLVVSGDNGREEYDEPTQMKEDLIKAGVPENKIYCDYAGFSTIDSMLRMKMIFHQTEFIVISQRFHLERAIYIARRNGMEAFGIPAEDVPSWYAPYNGYREKLARVKSVFEVLVGKGPYFEGDPIEIK